MDGEVRVLLQFGDARERHEDRGVELAGLHVQHAGVVVGHGDPLDAVEADPVGLPEIRVLLEDDPVAAPPFLDGEGAGGDGVLGIGLLAQRLAALPWRGSRRSGMASVERNGAVGCLQLDRRASVVGRLGGVHHLVAVGPERALVVADAQ